MTQHESRGIRVPGQTGSSLAEDLRELPWRLVAVSVIAAVLVALALVAVTVRVTGGFAVWSDGVAYFLYARSAVIDHDVDITNEFNYLDARIPSGSKAMEPLRKWSVQRPDRTVQAPWPVGAGLILAPFYAVGYGVEIAVARLEGRPADSYGLIPQCAFILGSVAFGMLAFWCLVLLCHEVTTAQFSYLAGLGAVLCGPAVFYVLVNPSMAHASSLGLIAVLTVVWLRAWNRGPTVYTILLMGTLLGVATIIRYQNVLFGILPAALVAKDWKETGLAAMPRAAVGALAFLVPVAPLLGRQLAAAGAVSDQHNVVSIAQYPVDLASPYFWDVLFSCRHGAFHWAPLLGISLVGLVWELLRKNGWAGVLLGAFAANVYLIGGLGLSNIAYGGHQLPPGWLHHWDDAPSFGMRYLTECAPIFALGFACLMERLRRRLGLVSWAAILASFATWNALLIPAYGLETITRSGCLTYKDMLAGVAVVLRRLYIYI